MGQPLLLDAYAARSCPVKTQYAFEPGDSASPMALAVDDPAAVRAETARRRRAVVLEQLIGACTGRVVDLRLLADDGPDVQAAGTRRALETGADVVVGARLPLDPTGHRAGAPDVLVRGRDAPDGRPQYHPVVVKGHQITVGVRSADQGGRPSPDDPEPLRWTPLERPSPVEQQRLPGRTIRLRWREHDFRQLAHYWRMLQTAGFAPADLPGDLSGTPAWAGVIGTDAPGERSDPVIAWADLAAPALRTYDAQEPDGWSQASVLQRYDAAFDERLAIARAAQDGQPPSVEPVVVRECATCPWWTRCRARLDEDDISLHVDRGAFDRREVEALRSLGAGTVTTFAEADPEAFLPAYLPLVAHRGSAEARWRTARRRVEMLRAGTLFARETDGPIEVRRAALEIDFDLETAADGRVYLWGFWVERPDLPGSGRYVAFGRFDDLDAAGETALAVQALTWLRQLVETEPSIAVYHYSAFEVSQIQTLAARSPEPSMTWAAEYAAQHFVDLLEIVKLHWFGVHGLGLKLIAAQAGFRWRDDDPGGLNSQRWFAEAVHGDEPRDRAAARQRVLDYNEDDVRATRALRRWLSDPGQVRPSEPSRSDEAVARHRAG